MPHEAFASVVELRPSFAPADIALSAVMNAATALSSMKPQVPSPIYQSFHTNTYAPQWANVTAM